LTRRRHLDGRKPEVYYGAMRVGLAQIDCILGDVDKNLRRAKEIIEEAKDRGADLVVFPELSLAGYASGELSNEVAIEAKSAPLISLADEAGETAVVVAEGPGREEALIIADIDLGNVRRRRREVPLVKEARLALLSRELNRLAEEGGDL
jgi:predicted amidohydrolase